MDKLKNFFSLLPSILILLAPFLLGLALPKIVLISLGTLYFTGFFKSTGSGIGPAMGDALFAFLGILGAIGGVIGLLISIFAQ